MTVDHSIISMQEQQQNTEPRRKSGDLPKPSSLDISLVKSTTDKPSNRQLDSCSSSPSPSPRSPSKPLVFKKPTKHQFSWKELEQMVASKDLTPMGRSEQVQEAYQRAIKRRTKKYGSPDEYIRQRILHWPPAEKNSELSDGNESSTSSSSSNSLPPSPTGPVDPLEVRLEKNEFPYSVKPGIEHWLIWSRNMLTDEDWIRAYLNERLPGRDFLFFINPPELRSVPTIFHVQVFTKGEGVVLDEEDIEMKMEDTSAAAATKNK